ncbi:hypothetical protein NVP2117O_15 [Vibrio phage 2.117.O._10N.261.45.E9]|nr:hypothetical protein NVP1117O_15 [Vibrio phage 1.117.O._10N.261.45.E9]AUR95416.1 hypothetical protein NVP1207B_09 [Vibrio phage 1.207.B._10N.222.51.C2]AUS02307.1 hypothetical protein NVP2117O_15 [Vibrio phage 2.117.O._10N.261.45.E9]
MPLIRLTRHQNIKVISENGMETIISPEWGDKLILRVSSNRAENSGTVKPIGYARKEFSIRCGAHELECAVFLHDVDKRWLCELRGPQLFNISRVDKGIVRPVN